MDIAQVKTIGVIGAGTMGLGISQVAAQAGFEVIVHDANPRVLAEFEAKILENIQKAVDKGKLAADKKDKALGRIGIQEDLKNIKVDFIMEAVIEDLDVKVSLFRAIQDHNPQTILASNTSSIPITQIASGLEDPSKLIGMHFFNPAHIMRLVEVISGAASNPEYVDLGMGLAKKMGKAPIKANDSPGFVVNRVARLFYVESLKILEEKLADVEDIDNLLESSGFKMGPFRLMDLIGVDTNLTVTKTIYGQFWNEAKFRPSLIQQQLVDAGHFGKKTGRGFYEYQ